MTSEQLDRELRRLKNRLCCINNFTNSLNNSASSQRTLYKAPDSFMSLENGLVLNGSMSTATLTTVGPYDNIDVGFSGSIESNNIHFASTQFSVNEKVIHVKVKVNSIVGANNAIGLYQVDVPSGTYSSSSTASFFGYVDLSTGDITTSPGAGFSVVDDNQWTAAIAAGEIIDLYLFHKYAKYYKLVAIKGDSLKEVTYSDVAFTEGGGDGNYRHHNPHSTFALILSNLDCTILGIDVYSENVDNLKIAFVGDSMSAGHYIPAEDMIMEIMRTKIPYNVQTFAGRGERLKGMLACMHEWLPLRPQYVVLEPWQAAIRDNYSDTLNANYATFQDDFARAVAAIKSVGAIPIFPYLQSWSTYATVDQCDDYRIFLETFYPNERRFRIDTDESFYDVSGFHYTAATNEIYCDKVLEIIKADGNL